MQSTFAVIQSRSPSGFRSRHPYIGHSVGHSVRFAYSLPASTAALICFLPVRASAVQSAIASSLRYRKQCIYEQASIKNHGFERARSALAQSVLCVPYRLYDNFE
jgi:hypothetical protein